MSEPCEFRGEGGLRLAADVFGPADGPPALFFHGSGQTRQSWGRAAADLGAAGWRAYTVDHRGHGDSDWPDHSAYEHTDIAQDIMAICDALDRPPLVVGASLGGSAALIAQGLRPDQLYRGLVLVDITPTVDIDGARRNGSIVLYDSMQTEVARWNFVNGWPSVWKGSDLDAGANEIAVEEVTIAHEGLERA